MKDLQLEKKPQPCTLPFKMHSLSLSVSRVGQMQQGKATSWRGSRQNTGTLGGEGEVLTLLEVSIIQ